MSRVLAVLWLLFAISLSKESGVVKNKDSKSKDSDSLPGYSISDAITLEENECCSEKNPKCCVSLTWSNSISKQEHVPPEFGGQYFCENFEIIVSKGCDPLDSIYLPVSKSCDFTRVLWSVRCDDPDNDSADKDCTGFMRAQVLVDGEIVLNNADEFLVSPSDEDNPTGYHALKVPIDYDEDTKTITICTQLQWGDVIQDIDGKGIRIGYSVNNDMFSCSNSSIRDICSIDASLAQSVDKAHDSALNVMDIHGDHHSYHEAVDEVPFDGMVGVFEYYWSEYFGLVMAVFAGSIFFNIVMCIFWSRYNKAYEDESEAISKVMIDTDDQTETESEDSDELDREDPLFI
eukprot:517467_1